MPVLGQYKYDVDLIKFLCDGQKTSSEIASVVGCSAKYVQSQMKKHGLARLSQGARRGPNNPAWVDGRSVDLDGYALVPAPDGYHAARKSRKNYGIALQHRLVAEKMIGRHLTAKEVVDHIDGLHLHNDPSNLRVFASNADHLHETLTGKRPQWSEDGRSMQFLKTCQRKGRQPMNIYSLRKKRGDVRLQQILLAWFQFEPASPHLLGTRHLLERIGIDPFSRSSLEQAWADLCSRWSADLLSSG